MTRPRRRGGGNPTMRVWTDSIKPPSRCPICTQLVTRTVLAKRQSLMVFDGIILGDNPTEESQTPTKRSITLVDLVDNPTHYQTCRGPDVERTK